MKNHFQIFAMLALLISIESFGQKTWTGTTSTAWNTTTNWSPTGVPIATDNVIIPSAPANQPLVSGTSTPVCNNLTINSGASLTINGTSSNNALLTASGTAIIFGSLSVGSAIGHFGSLTVNNITWASGSSMSGAINGGINVSGHWEFATGSAVSMGYSTVTFTGSANSNITSNSANSNFYSLTLNKTGGASVNVISASTSTLTLNGNINIGSGAVLNGQANITTILKGNLVNAGNINMGSGILSFEKTSGTQSVQINTNDSFNSININTGGTVTISTSFMMQLMGNMVIQAGVLDPNGCVISLFGDWNNYVGTAGFTEGTGTVVFNGGNYHQYCSSENFYNLEVYKTLGGALRMNGTTVTCSRYNWTAGSIDVLSGGTFTANDLTDDAIVGSFYCNNNCTINLYNYGGNIDLRGNLYIYGGNFNVYGGVNPSWWPYQGNASITMSGGVLNFEDQGILIRTDGTYTFTNSITGGTIRTAGLFTNGRADFAPTAGILELYGSNNSLLTMTAGSLNNLTISKQAASTVSLSSNVTVGGITTINSGTLLTGNRILSTGNNITINSGGTLWVEAGAQLRLTGSRVLTVNTGGTLKVIGTSGSNAMVTRNGTTSTHEFQVYGNISARNAIFEYNLGINIWGTATVDPLNPFDYCTFQNGADRFLFFSNNQEIMIRGASFPTAPVYNNVWKNNNAGRINFRDAIGAYAGQSYENDPYNRIDWTTTQPGLWTGAISTDWHTAGNWDDLLVPDATKNVTIPIGVANMPVVSATANCNNLTLNGTLTIGNASIQVNGNAAISGNVTMTHASGILNFYNDVTWNSGSTASIAINSSIRVYGNWVFSEGANVQFGFGTVFFLGAVSKEMLSYSATCSFYNISISKTGGANLAFGSLSTQDLNVISNFRVESGSLFKSYSTRWINVNGNILVYGTMQCESGTVKLDGTVQSLMPNVNDYFNDLAFSQTGIASINTTYTSALNVKGDLHIDSGVFEAGNCTINIGGAWDNNVGTEAFAEGGSRVVINGGNYHQYCTGETFNILEVNKALGSAFRVAIGTVTCAQYDWTAGAVDVGVSGTFTALDLVDQGIRGNFYVNPGCTMNLYQDVSQSVDLGGNLTFTDGGTINIYGGNGTASHWPANANASITMNGGELNFADQGILIQNNATYTLTTNISGGTIKTSKDFTNSRTGFALTAGTVEMAGTTNTLLTCSQGSLFNVNINKGLTGMVTMNSNAVINGLITLTSGTLLANGKVISAIGGVAINSGGILWIENGTQLQIGNMKSLWVSEGGLFKSIGLPTSRNRLTHYSGLFEVQIHGTIAASQTIFEYSYGINIWPTAIVDLLNPLDQCTFQNGDGVFLLFTNNQELIIRGANFPTATASNNVWKDNNAGRVNFRDATGAFAGQAFESDPYNRIDWSTTQPGLWTGTISTDWNSAGNWDDLIVPTATTDVVIPAAAPNMPIVGNANAVCNSLTVNGMLTIANRTLETGTAVINGNLSMNHYLGVFKVNSYINWNSGSTASITAMSTMRIKGDWTYNTGANVQLTNGSVYFEGFTFSRIYNYDDNSSFNEIYVAKTESSILSFDAGSTYPIRVKNFYVDYNSEFYSNAAQNINVTGNFYSFSTTQLDNGAIVFEGADHIFIPHPDAFYHDIIFNQSGTVTINQTNTNILDVRGDIIINSGVLNAEDCTIKIAGSWLNNVGEEAFNETGSRVIFNGTTAQFSSTEAFNILEIDKSIEYLYDMTGSNISCQVYDWTQGGLWIAGGSNFYAADLADNGIYGNFVLWSDLIELHQDASQSIDLHGTLSIHNGEFKVYGGMEQSYWGSNANAGLTMTNGVLDFVDQAISIYDQAPYSFTSTISGGIIRSQKGFIAQSAGFNPTGGTVEIYGNQNSLVAAENGAAFYNLTMNKSPLPVVCYLHSAQVTNILNISNGTVIVPFGNTLSCGNVAINEGGDFRVSSSIVKLKNGGTFNVNSGGYFSTDGYEGATSTFTGITPADRYSFQVNSGGWMSANYTVFEYMSGQGIYIASGTTLNQPDAFNNCEFRNGLYGQNPLLTINNSQDVIIENAIFPANTWGGQYNVRKSVDAGSVTFVNAIGPFAGESFENDPYSRIHWGEPKQLNLTLFLEGLYSGQSTMRQAYGENGPHFGAGIADEIRVEFRSGLDYYEMEHYVDHVLLGTNGQASIELPSNLSASYYITIRHRNSIETTTPVPVSFASGVINYSYDAPAKAYGGNLLQMITGQYVIYGGDVTQDGYVDTGDMTPVDNGSANFESGYLPTDVNGDGFVDTGDMTIIDNNSAGFVGAVTP